MDTRSMWGRGSPAVTRVIMDNGSVETLAVGSSGGSVVDLNCTLQLSPALALWSKGAPFRTVIGLTCALSMLGALLIVISYLCYDSLRSNARWILLHLSLMDFGVGLSNLIGNLVYFDRFYYTTERSGCYRYHVPEHRAVQDLCIAQAFFAMFFTYSSVLWTVSLAVYLYFLIVRNKTPMALASLRLSYVLCYGLPAVLCLWLVFTDRLGYSPKNTGWCSILIIDHMGNPDIFIAVVGYDLWIYLAIVMVSVLYLSVQQFIKQKFQQSRQYLHNAEERFWEAVHILDYRFLLIPLAFTILRMWTCLVDILYVYIQVKTVPLWFDFILLYLSGIGDSGQGFANAILFVVVTKRVRQTIFSYKYWKEKLCLKSPEEECLIQNESSLLRIDGSPVNCSLAIPSDIYTPDHPPTSAATGTLTGSGRFQQHSGP